MNNIKPNITNDIASPCNKNKCSFETIASCCGCPEWFAWKAETDIGQTYKGKHEKPDVT